MKHLYKVLLCCNLISLSVFGQNAAQQIPCGFDAARQTLLNTDPSYKQKEENVNQLLYQRAINSSATARNSQSVLSIPVVVHIIHQNGPENITDSLVIAGIDQLNLRFQNVAPYYNVTGNNVGIQFCLASVDPFGNPTTGITRTVSPYTDLAASGASDLSLKNLNRWDPNLYLNVWIIRNTGTNPGYASYPAIAGSGIDGIVLQYNIYNAYQLTHEVGHYLGLLHTFYNPIFNTCTNYNCLLDGDQVCDTPPDNTQNTSACGGNSCSTEMNDTSGFNPFTSDVNDLPNYMDYTACPLSFTPGQCNRMNDALSLVRTTLLQSNGCGQHPGGPVPVASFTANPGCGGEVFTNTSTNSVGAEWDFNSDGQIDDAGNTLTYNPPVSGYYTVTMYAQGYGGMDTSATLTIYAQHYPYQNYPLVNGYGGVVTSPTTGLLTACQGATITFQGAPGMAHYYWSNGDTTQNTTFIQGTSPFTISLSTVDSSGLTWSTCYPIPIAAAPAPIPPVISIAPNDTVFCIGSPVHLQFTYSPIWYSGHLSSYLGTIQGFHNSTYTTTLGNFNYFSIYQTDANGCISTSNLVNITGTYPTYPSNITQLGNNVLYYSTGLHTEWYFNGTAIPNSDTSMYQMTQIGCYKAFTWWAGGYNCGTFSTDSVCLTILGTQQNYDPGNNITISPNPFTSQTTFSFAEEQKNATIKIMDVAGKEIKTINFSGKQFTLEKGEMSSGIYFVQITDQKKNVINKKIVIQ